MFRRGQKLVSSLSVAIYFSALLLLGALNLKSTREVHYTTENQEQQEIYQSYIKILSEIRSINAHHFKSSENKTKQMLIKDFWANGLDLN